MQVNSSFGHMKKVVAVFCLGVSLTGALAQGLVHFANDPTTLVTYQAWTNGVIGPFVPIPANNPGAFYFGLLTAASPAGPFTFTGIYATNSADAGLFGPASYTPTVPGWAPGASMFYEVAGWSASLGPTFNPVWLTGNLGNFGYFGVSPVGLSVAGGHAPQARLSASVSGDSIVISWAPSAGTLQSSPLLRVGEVWSTVGTANPARITISGDAKFFRVLPAVYVTPNLFGPASLPGFGLWTNGV